MELANGGSLDMYLRKHTVDLATKLRMCTNAASGLAYLHLKKCVHRDVASRYVFLFV